MINLNRRFFCFGAAATVILPPPKSFFILPRQSLILRPLEQVFDLPRQQMLSLLRKLDEQMLDITAIPRWVVTDKAWYDAVVRGTGSA